MSAWGLLRGNSETEFANRKFVPTSINLKNESAGDGRGDKTIEKTILRTFHARTFSRSQGHSRRIDRGPATSGQPQGGVRRNISKDELDAYHLDAPPNYFANPMLAAFEKRQFETTRDNGVNHDLRAML